MTDEHNHEENSEAQVTAEQLVAAYNNLLAENNKLKKMVDELAIKVARHTVEVTERDVVIQSLQAGVARPQQPQVSEEE